MRHVEVRSIFSLWIELFLFFNDHSMLKAPVFFCTKFVILPKTFDYLKKAHYDKIDCPLKLARDLILGRDQQQLK